MIPKNPKQWKRVDQFLMRFDPKEKIVVVHDADPDGLCSAVLLSRLIKKLRGKPVDYRLVQPGERNTVHPKLLATFKKKKISKAIFVDLPVHEDEKGIKKLEKQCSSLIIDHHTFFKDVTSEKTVLAMPQLIADNIDPSRYCTSKLVYDFAARHASVEDLDWIAAIGIIADMAGKEWTGFLAKVFKKYGLKPNPKDWFHTKLGEISGMLFATMTVDKKNIGYCFRVLMKAAKPQEVFNDKKLKSYRQKFDKEINKWVSAAPKKAEKHKNVKLLWYEVKPKYRVNSPIATILSLKPEYKDWVVLIVDASGDKTKISGRCQSQRVKMNELLKATTKSLKNASGGGHVPAAGASVRKKDLPELKKKILGMLSKNLYTTA